MQSFIVLASLISELAGGSKWPPWSLTLQKPPWSFREVSFFTGRGGPWKFLKFCKFLVIPPTVWVKFFWSPWGIAEFKWSPHVIIKAWAEIVSVFEAESDYALGLLKVKAGNLSGILTVIWVKLQNSHHINILYKKFSRQLRPDRKRGCLGYRGFLSPTFINPCFRYSL